MRTLHLADDLRLRFPGQDDDFDEGFEVGMVAALMSLGQPEIRRRVSARTLEQLSAVAVKLGYFVERTVQDAAWVEVIFCSVRARSKLRLVHSRNGEPLEASR